jgi:hypothetical protein
MDEKLFFEAVNKKAKEYNLNPLLLLSGIEGLYSFKDVVLNEMNYRFLDNLILTIFALRIGDSFHKLAEQNLQSTNPGVREAAVLELIELTGQDIVASSNAYLQSFASLVGEKTGIRKYHEKALDVAALEIGLAQEEFRNTSIGSIMLEVCTQPSADYDFSFLFRK